jgi:hypothetical protein
MTPMNGWPTAMENLPSFELQSTGSVTGSGWPSTVILAGGVAGGGGAAAVPEALEPVVALDGAAELDAGPEDLLPLEQPVTPAIAVAVAIAINSSRFNRHLLG